MSHDNTAATAIYTFRGHSDDTFGWDCSDGRGDDHDDSANHRVRTYVLGSLPGHRLAVTGVYGLGCMWAVGIAPLDDDEPLPGWPMTWSFEDYSAVLRIEAPLGLTPILVWPRRSPDA